MRKVVPALTEATGGISGCQRLCPSTCCWLQGLERSTLNRVSWRIAAVVMISLAPLALEDDSKVKVWLYTNGVHHTQSYDASGSSYTATDNTTIITSLQQTVAS